MALLDEVKAALRISATTTVFDGEVAGLIAAAQTDLNLSGTLQSKIDDHDDALIKQAIMVYCKANFGFDNPEALRFQGAYDSIKRHLTLSQEYTIEVAP